MGGLFGLRLDLLGLVLRSSVYLLPVWRAMLAELVIKTNRNLLLLLLAAGALRRALVGSLTRFF